MNREILNSFAFSNPSSREKKQALESRRLAEEISDKVIQRARECLDSDMFSKYKAEYAQAREELIEVGVKAGETITDPIQYSFVCRSIFDRLLVLRQLADAVTGDSKRKTKAEQDGVK